MNQVPVLSNQLNLPFTLDDAGGINAVYIDQAPMFGCVSASYTPYGIKILDRDFIQEIKSFEGDKDAMEELKWRILNNTHLHYVIKQNLVANLERVYNDNG